MGRGPVREPPLQSEWGQPSLVPGFTLLKEEEVQQGGAVLPLIGGRKGDLAYWLPVTRLHTLPTLKLGAESGLEASASVVLPLWSERERAAHDKELSLSSNR